MSYSGCPRQSLSTFEFLRGVVRLVALVSPNHAGGVQLFGRFDFVVPSKCESTCEAVTTPEAAEGCTDDLDECHFYQHHPDACGRYDSATFNASNM